MPYTNLFIVLTVLYAIAFFITQSISKETFNG